jgi:hypothetical protein
MSNRDHIGEFIRKRNERARLRPNALVRAGILPPPRAEGPPEPTGDPLADFLGRQEYARASRAHPFRQPAR